MMERRKIHEAFKMFHSGACGEDELIFRLQGYFLCGGIFYVSDRVC